MAINDITDRQDLNVKVHQNLKLQGIAPEDIWSELIVKNTLKIVETLIRKLPFYGILKEEDYWIVKEAREAYNRLTEHEKAEFNKFLLNKLLNDETTIYFNDFEKKLLEWSKTDLDENDFNFISSLPLDYYDDFLDMIARSKRDFKLEDFKIWLDEKELHKNTMINKLLDYAAEQQQERYIKILEIELGKHQEILDKEKILINILKKSQFNDDDFNFLDTLKWKTDILNIVYLIFKNKYAALRKKWHYVFPEKLDENLRRQYKEENEKLKPDLLELDRVLCFVYYGLLWN